MESFALRLKNCRKEKNLTQVQLAKELGVGNGVVADVERGARNPSKNLALTLSEFFDTDVMYWLDEEKEIEKEIKHHTKYEILDTTLDSFIERGLITDLDFSEEVTKFIMDAVKMETYIKLEAKKKK